MRLPAIYLSICALAACIVPSCERAEVERVQHGGAAEFASVYNSEITEWLDKEMVKKRSEFVKIQAKATASPNDKAVQAELAGITRSVKKLEYRLDRGDYFQIKKSTDIPKDLVWTSGELQPEVGDSSAKKGGVFNYYITSFPSTLRYFGPEANGSFRSYIYDTIELPLVGPHPVTQKNVPMVAKEWAVTKDGRTVFYRIDPDAKYSDGEKVKAFDVFTYIYVRVSPFVNEPYWKQYFREQVAGVSVYGDDVVAVSLPEQKPKMVQFAAFPPAPSHFYKNYGPDFTKFYQWKVQPTTGAYLVDSKDVVKGISVTMTRNKNWWAKDKRYFKNRFNPDKIRYQVIGDVNKAFELFRSGKIDYYEITSPKYWFEKSEIDPVFDGYIERRKFYNQYPRVPRGLHLNVSRPILKDLNVRLGIQHAMNFQKVIDVVYRGEFSRLKSFSQGFGEFTNKELVAREYSVLKAKEYFTKAGYTEMGDDGILRKPDGSKLSVSITFANYPSTKDVMAKLKEFAIKAGLELRLDGLERTVCFQKVAKKQHEITYTGWGVTLPYPRYFQFFHSTNAYDEKGNPKPSTNNINCYSNPLMDKYAEAMRNARTEAEIRENAIPAQKLLWDDAIFVPAFMTNYFSVANWRWVRWPNSARCMFGTPLSRDPMEDHMFWIDADIKAETLKAKASKKTFPEVQEVIDIFKNDIPEEYLKP